MRKRKSKIEWRQETATVCLSAAAGMELLSFFVLGNPRGWILIGSLPAFVSLIFGSRMQRTISLILLLFAVAAAFSMRR